MDRCEASKLGLDRIAKQKRLEKELTKGLEVLYRVVSGRLKYFGPIL